MDISTCLTIISSIMCVFAIIIVYLINRIGNAYAEGFLDGMNTASYKD